MSKTFNLTHISGGFGFLGPNNTLLSLEADQDFRTRDIEKNLTAKKCNLDSISPSLGARSTSNLK
jgi:hypothetical protein